MKLVIISGRSGSGKSTALHVLEDLGFYCIDNIPGGLLPALIAEMENHQASGRNEVAVSVDARNLPANLKQFPSIVKSIDRQRIDYSIVPDSCRTVIGAPFFLVFLQNGIGNRFFFIFRKLFSFPP